MAKITLFERLAYKVKDKVPLLRQQGADADPKLIAEIVEDLQELAKVKSSLVGQQPWIKDELYVYALEQLYEGVKKAAVKLVDDNIVYYLAQRLNRNLRKAVYKLFNPGQSWDSNHAKDGRKNWSMQRHEIYEERDCVVWTEPQDKLLETIRSLCIDDMERLVINELETNKTLREVADDIGISHTTVGIIRGKVHERYRAYVREEANRCIIGGIDGPVEEEPTSDVSGVVYAESTAERTDDSILAGY